jgi:hypothetical protein
MAVTMNFIEWSVWLLAFTAFKHEKMAGRSLTPREYHLPGPGFPGFRGGFEHGALGAGRSNPSGPDLLRDVADK